MLIFPFPVKTTPPLSALRMGTKGAEQQRVSHSGAGMLLLWSPSLEPPHLTPPILHPALPRCSLPHEAASALGWPRGSNVLGVTSANPATSGGHDGIRGGYSIHLRGQESPLQKGLGTEAEVGRAEIWGWKGGTSSAAAGPQWNLQPPGGQGASPSSGCELLPSNPPHPPSGRLETLALSFSLSEVLLS